MVKVKCCCVKEKSFNLQSLSKDLKQQTKSKLQVHPTGSIDLIGSNNHQSDELRSRTTKMNNSDWTENSIQPLPDFYAFFERRTNRTIIIAEAINVMATQL